MLNLPSSIHKPQPEFHGFCHLTHSLHKSSRSSFIRGLFPLSNTLVGVLCTINTFLGDGSVFLLCGYLFSNVCV